MRYILEFLRVRISQSVFKGFVILCAIRTIDKPNKCRRSLMVNSIGVNLISGRTMMQGVAIEGHKHEEDYIKACGLVEMDVSDMKALHIYQGQHVKVKSAYGEVIVRAVKATQGPHPGLVFIPMGPWANQVTSTETYSTGMPGYKGVKVTIEPALDEPVLNGIVLLQKTTIKPEAKAE